MKPSLSSAGDEQWDTVGRTVKEESYGSVCEEQSDKAGGLGIARESSTEFKVPAVNLKE